MPQLVKGGKYVFGWAIINKDVRIRIPDETYDEYQLIKTDHVIILSGSRISGGFSIISPYAIINSKMGDSIFQLIEYRKETDSFDLEMFRIVKYGNRLISWTSIEKDKYFKISNEFIEELHLKTGDKLLVGRGSGLGPAFIAKGAIYEEALNHDLFEFD